MVSPSVKRSAPDDEARTSKRSKLIGVASNDRSGSVGVVTQISNKSCHGCGETDTVFPALSSVCKGTHSNDYCKLCYTKYINIKIIADVSRPPSCIQCQAIISHGDIERIIGVKNGRHYNYLIERLRAEGQGKIVCLDDFIDAGGNKVTCHSIHVHDVQKDGRTFHCSKCGNAQCIPCGVREHKGEDCDEFQARVKAAHATEDTLTAQMIQDGYIAIENGKETKRKPTPCPCCGVLIDRDGKCPHMTCVKCGNQFCIRCNAAYFGLHSVPALGNKVHKPECVYFKREKEDRRFVRTKKSAKVLGGETGT